MIRDCWLIEAHAYGPCLLTQFNPFGFAILGLHMPVTELACDPRFFQLIRSAEEYIIGVWSVASNEGKYIGLPLVLSPE